jgi:YfiH family protein
VRERFFQSLGANPSLVFGCSQSHSQDVAAVDRNTAHRKLRADGLVTNDPEVFLSVLVADCLPVYLLDTEHLDWESGSIPFGLVHSGWKGTGIALNALKLMAERWHTRPEAVSAVLGPCIRGCCYRVDAERAAAFESQFGGPGGEYPLGPVVRRLEPEEVAAMPGYGEFTLDLQAANARLLANAGVSNISVCEDCTYTDEQLGSFRREGSAYIRMAALVGQLERNEYVRL